MLQTRSPAERSDMCNASGFCHGFVKLESWEEPRPRRDIPGGKDPDGHTIVGCLIPVLYMPMLHMYGGYSRALDQLLSMFGLPPLQMRRRPSRRSRRRNAKRKWAGSCGEARCTSNEWAVRRATPALGASSAVPRPATPMGWSRRASRVLRALCGAYARTGDGPCVPNCDPPSSALGCPVLCCGVYTPDVAPSLREGEVYNLHDSRC